MKYLLVLLFLFQAGGTGFIHATVEHDNLTRSMWLYVPESYDPDVPVPLVFVFHPAGGSAQSMADRTGFNVYAEELGFIALYPEGYYGYFDYGAGYPSWADAPNLVNDPAFVSQIFEDIQTAYNIDPERIYAVGFSNGARMAFRMGCDLPLAGIAGVSATISDEVTKNCHDEMQPRVLFMHGTRDRVTPWAGKRLYIENQFISNALSAPNTARFWAEHNGCNPEPELQEIPTSEWMLSQETFGGCDSEVVFYGVQDGGHDWFQSEDVNASDLIMDFFFGEEE